MTQSLHESTNDSRYARAIAASRKARFDIDADVIRGRSFDKSQKFLPDGLSLANQLAFLTEPEQRLVSQIQGRTYARMFGLIERFVSAKVLEIGGRHALGNQVALEALVRFCDEELKHQELFRRIEALIAETLPGGYRFEPEADAVAEAVLGKPTWSVLALVFMVELVTQAHYKESIEPDAQLSELFRDVFRFHWMEESQHAVLDDLEWCAENARLTQAERVAGVTGLIELVAAVNALVTAQAAADSAYFFEVNQRVLTGSERDALQAKFLEAYRYQYIHSGVRRTRFPAALQAMIEPAEFERVVQALAAVC